MMIDYEQKRKVIFSMQYFIKNVLEKLPHNMDRTANAANHSCCSEVTIFVQKNETTRTNCNSIHMYQGKNEDNYEKLTRVI